MTSKIKTTSVIGSRILLGLIFFVFGLNFFFHFLPTPPALDGPAGAFTGGLFQSGYFFPMLKVTEVILGAFLLAGILVPISLVILMPISVNILLFHLFLAPNNAAIGIIILVLHIYLAWNYRSYYKPLFQIKASPAL